MRKNRRLLIYLALWAVFFLLFSGYSFSETLPNRPLAIFGELDWEEITSSFEGSPEQRNAAAVAMVLSLKDQCTGFLVSKDILMTNRHCVRNQREADGLEAEFKREAGVPVTQWETYRCDTFMYAWGRKPIAIIQDQDVALVRCRSGSDGKLPGEKWGVVMLTPYRPTPSNIYIIHHPEGSTKKLSRGPVIVGCVVESITKFRICHKADVLGGSSGAPIIDASTHSAFAINAKELRILFKVPLYNLGTWFSKLNPPLVLANPGPDRKAIVGVPLTLDGSNSVALFPPLSYVWKIVKKPRRSNPKLENPQSPTPTFTVDKPGEYILELTVRDIQGNRSVNTKTNKVKITAIADTTPPALITNFQASDNEDSRSTLTWTNPSDSDLAEVIVRRKTGSYPTNHTDGDLVYQNTSPTPGAAVTHVDTGLTNGTTYFYVAFSRDQAGNWNGQVVVGKNADTGRPQVVSTAHPWPMFQHDAQRTGRSPATGPQNSNIKWTFQDSQDSQNLPFWEPVVAANGTIYVGGGFLSTPGGLYAINPDGSLKWVNNTIRVFEGPVLGSNGEIFALDRGLSLVAINPQDGTEKWRYSFGVEYYDMELAIDNNGNIYLVTGCLSQNDQNYHPSLLAFNSQGSIIWLYDTVTLQTYPNGVCALGPGITITGGASSPTLDSQGNIYFAVAPDPFGSQSTLFALQSNGAEKWQRTFNSGSVSGISIHKDGILYVSVGAEIHALDPNNPNQDKWVQHVPGLDSSVTIGVQGDLYVTGGSAPSGTWWSTLYAFDSQGNSKWSKLISSGRISVPIIGGDGTIYIGGGSLYALGTDGSERWSSNACGASGDDSVIAGGSLVISSTGTLYAAGPQKLCAFGEDAIGSTSAQVEIMAVPVGPGSVHFLAAGAAALRVEIFNLAGKRVYTSDFVTGNSLLWDGLTSKGQRLANGVYLYVVTVRRWDGTIVRSQVKKLVVLR